MHETDALNVQDFERDSRLLSFPTNLGHLTTIRW